MRDCPYIDFGDVDVTTHKYLIFVNLFFNLIDPCSHFINFLLSNIINFRS